MPVRLVLPCRGIDRTAGLPLFLQLTTTAGFERYVCQEMIRRGNTIGYACLDGGPEPSFGTELRHIWAGRVRGAPINTGGRSAFGLNPRCSITANSKEAETGTRCWRPRISLSSWPPCCRPSTTGGAETC